MAPKSQLLTDSSYSFELPRLSFLVALYSQTRPV